MAASRSKKGLLSSRRRAHDDGEDDEAHEDVLSETQSEGSDAEDPNGSDLSDTEEGEEGHSGKQVSGIPVDESGTLAANGTGDVSQDRLRPAGLAASSIFKNTADTEAMMNGLQLEDGAQEEAVAFEDSAKLDQSSIEEAPVMSTTPQAENKHETMAERRAREHEEYKQKRQADPAFVPTRGGFFMHDQRNSNFGHHMQLGLGRGKGRGVHVNNNAGSARFVPQGAKQTSDKWAHDLHESVADARPVPHATWSLRPALVAERITFPSKSVAIGIVTVRIALPQATSSRETAKMTARQHTRLPDLRPPLRRDKPVRICLPGRDARYVFPSVDRSFVFIPRAYRLSQQPMHGISRFEPNQPASRRQSIFSTGAQGAGTASRRSSVMQNSASQANMPAVTTDPAQAVASLPVSGDSDLADNSQPVQHADSYSSYIPDQPHPPPSQPLRLEARRLSMPLHQPRPQKLVSLTTIDSPSSMLPPSAVSQEQQPFHQQMPAHMDKPISADTTMDRQPSFAGQYAAMTPLSSIPEVAINAQPFQPGSGAGQQAFYSQQYPQQQMYYYPQPDTSQAQYPPLAYMQDSGYYAPLGGQISAQAPGQHETAQNGLMQESNGMMYYYDPTQYMGGNAHQQYGMNTSQSAGNYYYGQGPANMMYYGQ